MKMGPLLQSKLYWRNSPVGGDFQKNCFEISSQKPAGSSMERWYISLYCSNDDTCASRCILSSGGNRSECPLSMVNCQNLSVLLLVLLFLFKLLARNESGKSDATEASQVVHYHIRSSFFFFFSPPSGVISFSRYTLSFHYKNRKLSVFRTLNFKYLVHLYQRSMYTILYCKYSE